MTDAPSPPPTSAVLATLIGVTWRRLVRGRALWVSTFIAALPVALAAILPDDAPALDNLSAAELLVMAVLPPVFLAGAIGEELEDRTSSYLWSRPIARWTLAGGKLLALAPVAVILICAGWFVAMTVARGEPPPAITVLAYALGALATSGVATGIALIIPRHAMALAIGYLVILDLAIGAIPTSLQTISITRQVRVIAGLHPGSSAGDAAIALAVITAVWVIIGLWRLRRLEA